jgi:hypothetical protein
LFDLEKSVGFRRDNMAIFVLNKIYMCSSDLRELFFLARESYSYRTKVQIFHNILGPHGSLICKITRHTSQIVQKKKQHFEFS